jgi:hypothetical protein
MGFEAPPYFEAHSFDRTYVVHPGHEGLRMSDTGEYRAHAAECVRLAQQTNDPQSKGSLLDMARAWLALVNQGQKNNDAPTLVYQTPEPRWQRQSQHKKEG